MIYIYESHLGGLYVEAKELSLDDEYCEQCGDYDNLVFLSDDIYEIAEFLRSKTDFYNTGGYPYEHTIKIAQECDKLLENEKHDESLEDE